MAKQKNVVNQLGEETMQDFIKFRVFLSLGGNRNLNKAFKLYYDTPGEMTPVWQQLAEKNRWVERATEHDKTNTPNK